jgi:hypothetical protein
VRDPETIERVGSLLSGHVLADAALEGPDPGRDQNRSEMGHPGLRRREAAGEQVMSASPPSAQRAKALRSLPPSPYPTLLKRHQVESIEARAATLAGYKALDNGRPPSFPKRLLWDLPDFGLAVLRLCRSHLAIEELLNAIPDAEERDNQEES